jgi:chromosome segregation ATPase
MQLEKHLLELGELRQSHQEELLAQQNEFEARVLWLSQEHLKQVEVQAAEKDAHRSQAGQLESALKVFLLQNQLEQEQRMVSKLQEELGHCYKVEDQLKRELGQQSRGLQEQASSASDHRIEDALAQQGARHQQELSEEKRHWRKREREQTEALNEAHRKLRHSQAAQREQAQQAVEKRARVRALESHLEDLKVELVSVQEEKRRQNDLLRILRLNEKVAARRNQQLRMDLSSAQRELQEVPRMQRQSGWHAGKESRSRRGKKTRKQQRQRGGHPGTGTSEHDKVLAMHFQPAPSGATPPRHGK